ncbi:MAG: hypothetical protein DRP94_05205, partial [Candidatus Latescibacterota bacterium]
ECDPDLAADIEQSRYPALGRAEDGRRTKFVRTLLGMLYGLLLALIAALLYISHLATSRN